MFLLEQELAYSFHFGSDKNKSKLFTKSSLTEIQDKMKNVCIKSQNKFYNVESKLKIKQKGRNQDINVKDMGNYRNIKKNQNKRKKTN